MSENADMSVSMTPPWSPSQDVADDELLMLMDDQDPFNQEENDGDLHHQEEIFSAPVPSVCFQCQGKGYRAANDNRSEPKSYIASGALSQMLSANLEEWPCMTVELFGEMFVAMEELSSSDTLFFLCR